MTSNTDRKMLSSNTVSVRFTPEEYPATLARAMNLFGVFGDVARLDITLGAATGCLLVTFFDVRSAMQVVVKFGGYAEYAPGAQHDFRAVSIPGSVFVELPAALSGFHTFGDIADVSIAGDDVVVEFYDMRAAQQVTFAVPGSRPRHQVPPPQAVAADPDPESLVKELMGSLARVQQTLGAATAKTAGGNAAASSPKLPTPGALAASAAAAQQQVAGKPVREKVNGKDLTKFDILPEKIKSGEEGRTTVMVRNIPKACSRESFVEMLTSCTLGDRYTFFYMPFDKRRSVHCGFAFVNFKGPYDVLTLHDGISSFSWQGFPTGNRTTPTTPPALSYARLQGQEQLMKHFSLSAVMYDSDARKRPQFIRGEQGPASPPGLEEIAAPAKVAQNAWLEEGSQPRYISFGAGDHGEKEAPHSNESAFLLSNAAGA
jgi:hypothetical protein